MIFFCSLVLFLVNHSITIFPPVLLCLHFDIKQTIRVRYMQWMGMNEQRARLRMESSRDTARRFV